MKPPLKGEGNRRQTVEGFCEIICLMCKVYEITPQSPAVTASLKGSLCIKGVPIKKSPQHSPLNSREM